MRGWIVTTGLLLLGLLVSGARADDSPAPQAGAKKLSTSDSEKVATLEAGIRADEQQLKKLRDDLSKRQAEYDAAIKEFNQLKGDVESRRTAHDELKKTDKADEVAASAEELAKLEKRSSLAQERVDLAIAERKSVQALLTSLETKLEGDRLALGKLLGEVPSEGTTPAAAPETKKAPAPTPTNPLPGVPAVTPAPDTSRPLSPRVAEAESVATKKVAEAQAAKRDVEELSERKQTLEENIQLERECVANANKRYDNLWLTLQTLEDELYSQLRAGKEFSALGDLPRRRDEARSELQATSREIQDHSERIQVLQTQLVGLQQEELAAAREAGEKERAATEASRKRWFVLVSEYALVALPRAAVVIAVVLAIRWLLRMMSKRLVAFVASAGRGTEAERLNHANTLVGVSMNALETAIYAGTILTVLQIFNVPVATLLGGVAVVGLAVAFGAQNLIRDYFSGFMILLENQYKINDTVTINNNTGTVERITLRITVLRDFEGKVYFIPNGQITSVVNQTHEWSRVVLDINVSYKERIEKVLSVLLELAEAICHEPGFSGAILREPELMGVEKLTDSAVVIRLCFVTTPDKKSPVQREMLRRIKNRFEELGIEIPYPQRTVHMLPLSKEAEG